MIKNPAHCRPVLALTAVEHTRLTEARRAPSAEDIAWHDVFPEKRHSPLQAHTR